MFEKILRHSSLLIVALTLVNTAWAGDNGLISKKSASSVKVTIDRLESAFKKKPGIKIFARINHKSNGAKVDEPLRPTTLLIFGNPRLGTWLMRSKQTAGIDLPMKFLAWEDDKGNVWLTYNDPLYIAGRHGVNPESGPVKKMARALDKLSNFAVSLKPVR